MKERNKKICKGTGFFCLDFNELAPSPVSWPSISLLGTAPSATRVAAASHGTTTATPQCVPCMEGNDENDGGD